MKSAKCLVERLNLFVWMIHAFIMEYRPLLALLKGFYYIIRLTKGSVLILNLKRYLDYF